MTRSKSTQVETTIQEFPLGHDIKVRRRVGRITLVGPRSLIEDDVRPEQIRTYRGRAYRVACLTYPREGESVEVEGRRPWSDRLDDALTTFGGLIEFWIGRYHVSLLEPVALGCWCWGEWGYDCLYQTYGFGALVQVERMSDYALEVSEPES